MLRSLSEEPDCNSLCYYTRSVNYLTKKSNRKTDRLGPDSDGGEALWLVRLELDKELREHGYILRSVHSKDLHQPHAHKRVTRGDNWHPVTAVITAVTR